MTLLSAWILKIIFYQPKPTISVNYDKKIDQLTKPKNYDPKDNAAPIISKALKSFKKHTVPDSTGRNKTIRIGLIHPKRLDELNTWINSNETSFTLAAQAADKPYYWRGSHLNLPYEDYLSAWQEWRELQKFINALIWRARLREKDNLSQSLNDLVIAYKISDYLTIDKNIAAHSAYTSRTHNAREQIIKNLTDIIQNNSIDSETLKNIQKTFENIHIENLSIGIVISRILTLDQTQRYFTDDGNGNGEYIAQKFKDFDTGLMGRDRGDYIEYFKYKRRIRKTIDDRKITIEKINKTHDLATELSQLTPWEISNNKGSSHGRILSAIAGPNFMANGFCCNEFTYTGYYESLCQHRAFICLLAINIFKIDKGHLPPNLNELVEQGYIKSIPMDPYSDKPLVYKLTDKGFILYSLGLNFKDDGGKYTSYESWQNDVRFEGDYIFWPVFPKENEATNNIYLEKYFTDPNYKSNGPYGY